MKRVRREKYRLKQVVGVSGLDCCVVNEDEEEEEEVGEVKVREE